MIATCENCGWEHRIRMDDAFNSYSGVGDSVWRVCNHAREGCKQLAPVAAVREHGLGLEAPESP